MPHPYRELVDQEAKRAEDDLSAFRSRSLTIVTTSSGIITLITAVVTFAASKSEEERGLSDLAIAVVALALALFLAAAVLALLANAAGDITRPAGPELERIVTSGGWSTNSADEQEREVAEVTVAYVVSVRELAGKAADRLNWAIALQIAGLFVAAAAGVVTMLTIN
jgi:hypothetical protein